MEGHPISQASNRSQDIASAGFSQEPDREKRLLGKRFFVMASTSHRTTSR
jgi:hypothetical protein